MTTAFLALTYLQLHLVQKDNKQTEIPVFLSPRRKVGRDTNMTTPTAENAQILGGMERGACGLKRDSLNRLFSCVNERIKAGQGFGQWERLKK